MSRKATKLYFQGGLAAGSVSEREVQAFLDRNGFTLNSLSQHFRHSYGQCTSDQGQYFFKFATSPGSSRLLRNEIEFLTVMKTRQAVFKTPLMVANGKFKGRNYYIAKWVEGRPLAQPKQGGTRGLADWIPEIVSINQSLLSLRRVEFTGDARMRRTKHRGKRYLRLVRDWATIASHQSYRRIDDLFELARPIEKLYRQALSHGDFSPWHIMNSADGLYLIDSELASGFYPKYYDVAHFYHRMYAQTGRRDIARAYLEQFRSEVSPSALNHFDKTVHAIIAARTIGGFCELAAGAALEKMVPFHLRLARDVIKGDLF